MELASLPVIYTVPGLGRVDVPVAVVAGNGVLTPGELGPIPFRFPAAREVTGLVVLPADGLPATLAGLLLEIVDENDEQIFSDHIGDSRGGREPFAFGCLAMAGRGFRPFSLNRIVRNGESWMLTLKNMTVAVITVGAVGIHHRAIT